MNTPSVNFRKWLPVMIGVLAFYAIIVLGYIVSATRDPHGATDFHIYWYGGHFIQEGRDPYQAYFSGESLPVRQPGLEIVPSNTSPTMFLIYPLSYLPWEFAKFLWMVCNFAFIFLIYRLVVFYLPIPGFPLDRPAHILLGLIFFDLSATRIAIENGQATVLVFLLIVSALVLADRAWLPAGILFGLGLSKYSVAFPIFLFLLYRRKYRILGVAILIQFLSVALLSLITRNPIEAIINEHIRIFFLVYNEPGVQLATLLRRTSLALPAEIVMTLIVFGLLFEWLVHQHPARDLVHIIDFHVLNILILWALLIAYHRSYDVLMFILFMVMAFQGLYYQGIWHVPQPAIRGLAVGLGITLTLLIVPPRLVDDVLPGTYDLLTNVIPAFLLLAWLTVTMVLLHRLLHQPPSSAQLQVQQD